MSKSKPLIEISLSVTDLLKILRTSGHLGNSDPSMGSSAELGVEVHRRVQRRFKTATDSIIVERSFSKAVKHHGHSFLIKGRIDLGVLLEDEFRVIEVKSCASPIGMKRIVEAEPNHPHRIQAALYAFLCDDAKDKISATIMYESTKNAGTQWLEVNYDLEQTQSFLFKLLDYKLAEIHLKKKLLERRKSLKKGLKFPFETHRESQARVLEDIRKGLKNEKALFLHAPTGSGKTVVSIFPALESSYQNNSTVIFGTSKNSQKIAALDTFRLIAWKNDKASSAVILGSRESLCINEDNPTCHPKFCKYAENYYAKMRDQRVLHTALKGTVFDGDLLKKMGEHWEVCPFELGLDLSLVTDGVVCDYNHIVSPKAQLERHFAEPERRKKVQLIVDECHNFPERVRSEHSPVLSNSIPFFKSFGQSATLESRQAKRYFERFAIAIDHFSTTACERIGKVFKSDFRVALDETQWSEIIDATYAELAQALQLAYLQYSSKVEFPKHNDPVLKNHQDFLSFDQFYENQKRGANKPYSLVLQSERETVKLQLLCKDSAIHLTELLSPMPSPLFMSATLHPIDHYASLMGYDTKSFSEFLAPSPFAQENKRLFVIPQVTTKYQYRSEHIPKIAKCVSQIISLQKVNTFVFTPSFAFMKEMSKHLTLPADVKVIEQEPGMKKERVEKTLKEFKNSSPLEGQPKGHSLTLLGVTGGSFSEGVDLPGKALESVIVVGPALPPVSLEQDLRQKYEKFRGHNGFDIVSVIPSMAKVNQAIGRLIRDLPDKGTCFLLDSRYTEAPYFNRLPEEWKLDSPSDHISNQLSQDIRQFWSMSQ